MSVLISGDFHANAVNEIELITKFILIGKYKKELLGDKL